MEWGVSRECLFYFWKEVGWGYMKNFFSNFMYDLVNRFCKDEEAEKSAKSFFKAYPNIVEELENEHGHKKTWEESVNDLGDSINNKVNK